MLNDGDLRALVELVLPLHAEAQVAREQLTSINFSLDFLAHVAKELFPEESAKAIDKLREKYRTELIEEEVKAFGLNFEDHMETIIRNEDDNPND